jgi:CRISPR-associated protein Cmr4
MFEAYGLIGLFTETPLHPGTGTTTGVVDLPIQRERHTDFPNIQSSGIKGALREKAERLWEKTPEVVNVIFGPKNSDHAGSTGITDARILAFPVRSLSQVYVWVTCPEVLSRLKRDLALAKMCPAEIHDLNPAEEKAFVAEGSGLSTPLVLEELLFEVDNSEADRMKKLITEILKFMPEKEDVYAHVREKLQKHLVVIPNDDFRHIVKTATQVSARIVLNERKTSENLWYEETLPSDSLFYVVVMAAKPRGGNGALNDSNAVLSKLKEVAGEYLQIGGNETVGMGWCAVRFIGGTT